MKIKIEKIFDDKKVLFSSKYGRAVGYWCNSEVVELKDYFVEIDIPYKLNASEFRESIFNECLLENDNGKTRIVALLEDYEEDGFTTIRMDNCIICFETVFSTEIRGMLNKYIEIKVNKIHLFNENVI